MSTITLKTSEPSDAESAISQAAQTLIDGGLVAWDQADYPVESYQQAPSLVSGDFSARFDPGRVAVRIERATGSMQFTQTFVVANDVIDNASDQRQGTIRFGH